VLTYTTSALSQDTEVTGLINLTLYAASTAPDTDFTAKLVVVHPDGSTINLTNGIQRASYRASLSQPSPITQARSTATPSPCGPPATFFIVVTGSDSTSPPVTSRSLTPTPTPATGSATAPQLSRPTRRSCTTPPTRLR
jgi:hypothetical protein